ncbi:uncharacterized protein LOC132702896 [Cylas formicarius]|uniref:uncharacterized protein LOC132702896 n=1 Tax=Cylas formicarius TaxID=197179 RepID=UPI002958D107|nr:uncharacterized protein LOC132702896 [Cylas formicarius]
MNRVLMLLLWIISEICGISAGNLSCYQCTRDKNVECGNEDLKPCSSISDRCAIHISKSAKDGFSVKRECGLAPCGFDDEMVNRGLGLDNCDRSKEEYSCTYCCKQSGCNRNDSNGKIPSLTLIVFMLITLLNLARDFIPPYFTTNSNNN